MTYAASRAFVVDTGCCANVKNNYVATGPKVQAEKTW